MLAHIVLFAALVAAIYYNILEPLVLNPKSKIPGPKLFALTKWRLALEDFKGTRTRTIHALHGKYGPIVRIGPNEVHCNSLNALRTIYGAGSGFERTWFYRMFDVYGKQNLFTFESVKDHSERKKLVANAYSKSLMLKGPAARMVQEKVTQYLTVLKTQGEQPQEIFSTLHYFSLDAITHFLYGPSHGGTSALKGNAQHRALLNDIVDPTRRYLSWFAVHLPALTKWMYTREGLLERILRPVLPMQKPTTYTGIRKHALEAFHGFKDAAETKLDISASESSIVSRLWTSHESVKGSGPRSLDSLDIASECADHLLAGIDTTADTLMFLIWALSQPRNSQIQKRLVEEVRSIPENGFEDGMPRLDVIDKLPYLDAAIKETLRLYAPLPASEPRSLPTNCVIDGYKIPARTIVNMSPYSLHRNADVFDSPLNYDPERWLGPADKVSLMNRWFWAFSSGGRMCIGLHLAMAEMTALTVGIYREYTTSIAPGFENKTPGITSRFEIFYDETFPEIAVSQADVFAFGVVMIETWHIGTYVHDSIYEDSALNGQDVASCIWAAVEWASFVWIIGLVIFVFVHKHNTR